MEEKRRGTLDAVELPGMNRYLWSVVDADPALLTAFVCECGESACTRTALLTLEQYAERRPGLIILHAEPET